MNQPALSALALACAAGFALAAPAGAATPAAGGADITLYRSDSAALYAGNGDGNLDDGYAVIREQRALTLQPGLQDITLGDLPDHLDAEALALGFPDGSARVVSQRLLLAQGNSAALTGLLAPLGGRTHLEHLAHDSALWGREVHDERYAVVADPAPPRRHTEVVDVHLIVRRGDEVLLARRSGTGYADGLLNAPSGHVEDGEDVRAAAIREAAEEIGVRIDPSDARVALVMQHRSPTGSARIGWFFEVRRWEGEPVNNEPAKCSQIGWYPLDALPDDMVAYCRAGIEAYRRGERFLLHWHRPGDPIAHRPHGPGRAVVLPHNE